MKKKSILIAGGTGFIGYNLALKAKKKGWSVTSISKNKPHKSRRLRGVNYIFCDLKNRSKLRKKIKSRYQYVINLAGYVDHSSKIKVYDSHFLGSKNLSDLFLDKSITSFIQIGSSMEYGKLKSPQFESFKCKPLSFYGKAKLSSTKYLLGLYKNKNFPATVLRLYQIYGNKQDTNRFLPIIIKNCLQNKSFPCSNGKQFRDFLHIDDLIKSIFICLKSKNTRGNIINIGSGRPKKIKNIILLVKKLIKGGKPQLGKIKLRKEETLKLYPSINKAKKLLNWKPNINFLKGLKSTIKFYREEKK